MIPARLRFEVLERDEFTCQYCGAKAPDAILQVDHVVAKSNGGPTEAGNLITACRSCNVGKTGSMLAFVPDHILERAGSAYERGTLVRAEISKALRPEAGVPATPIDAPDEVLESITSDSHALSLSLKAARISQSYLAGVLGFTQGYVSRLVAGKVRIPDHLVESLCAATGSNLLSQYRLKEKRDERLVSALRGESA